MSHEVGHFPCPKCKSKDNVYRWADGHEWCFGGCGYYKLATLTKERVCALLKERSELALNPDLPTNVKPYPEDAGRVIKDPGLTWIKSYGITDEEIATNNILWSVNEQQLIFPIFPDPTTWELAAWQARNFFPFRKKYHTEGAIDDVLIVLGLTKHENPAIVLVEDMISAIKVSRFHRAMPLFGSSLSRSRLVRLRYFTTHLKFWLDSDKLGTAMKLSKAATMCGMDTRVIHTELDPKCLSNSEIEALGSD